ncbi:alpha-hydroxy-acid oxidizing enzyme [Mycobacterium stomatepiae]|uniref:Putative L-lactate dehydrogenase n=2 Tax=Mycobacterium stomatepiae TaxID=470076 RepID=A0A7I7Q3F1_9MYCO|nr:alpha-hydroxy-acid oxidizing enzyme [Mycobacterium stomatepiae]
MTAFSSAAQLLDNGPVDRGLRDNEACQIEGIVCGVHMTTVTYMVVKRRMPKARDLAPLMQFKRPVFDATRRRLDAAFTIDDLRRIAKRRTPKAAFDYTDGAAEDELSLERARQAFRDIEFHPTILRDVSTVTTGWDVLGLPVALPFGIAPTGFTRLMQTEGEIAGAAAAARAGIPFALSTLGTCAIEDLVTAVPQGRKWFQLYMWKDRERSMALVKRAADAGFDTLLATVDVPVSGARFRDNRNGMTIPPSLTLRTVLDAVPHPKWWFDLLTTEPLAFASLDRWPGTVGEYLSTMFDPSLTFDDLVWIKQQWPGKLVVKGIQTLEDARAVVERGVDGIVLSNHGGRQLDRAPVPFHLLPVVARELGKDTEVVVDTGIMSGADIVAAIALGARFTLVGRAYLYGLMAGGEAGVNRAIEILESGILRTMRLLGVRSLEELSPAHVTQLRRLGPVG